MVDYAPILEPLTDKERLYVEARLKGVSKKAALRAAGWKGHANAGDFDTYPAVIEAFKQAHALSAKEVGITREKVGEMLMQAYHNSTNAAEQIMAARELGRLFGLYSPEKVEVAHRLEQVAREGDLKQLSNEELHKLAKLERGITFDGDFQDITGELPRITADTR